MSATIERIEAAANSQLGRAVPRRDGPAKVKGEAQYVDDLPRNGVWIGATIRSPAPHGLLRDVRFAADFDPGSVVVVTAADIPGENVVPVVLRDQPSLADKVVRYVGEPVALVAAPDEETLRRALDRISVDVDPLPASFDIDDALSGRVRVYGDDNLSRRIEIQKGDCDAALDGAEVVVEGEYFTGAQEHVYLEPQGMQAEPMGDGMLLRGSMQCPHYLVEGVAVVLGWAPERVRVIPCTTGGGFGGKEDFPTMVAGHAALLAWKAKRPVRLIYSRVEDLAFSSKRHPSRVRHRTGWTRDGRLVAMRIDVDLDGGAYSTLSPLVLQRAAVHAAGPYRCDHVKIVARAVATNHPPRGAFRGFGAPQSLFALEAHMDRCAAQLKIDPIELRRRNHLGPGDSLATGQCVHGDAAVGEVLERALAESRYFARRAEFDRHNARAAAGQETSLRFKRRGIGVSLFMHGTGLNGDGEQFFSSKVKIRGNPDGTISALTGQMELGQGAHTAIAQLTAEGVGVPVEWVVSEPPDTDHAPNSGPTVASRTAAVVGGLLVTAGRRFRAEVERRSGGPIRDATVFRSQVAALLAERPEEPLEAVAEFKPPADFRWDEATHRGDAYVAYTWSFCVVALEVDTLTGEVTPLDATAVQDVGRVVNPVFATGQVEGGVAQGLGWALLERSLWSDGRMLNANMTDYVIPTAVDVPPIRVAFIEHPAKLLPHGAKGLGEVPHEGPAPAVVNALRHALGLEFNEVPVTPETILRRWEDRNRCEEAAS